MADTYTDTKLTKIEDRLDKSAAGGTLVLPGGVQFRTMLEVMEFSKLMAISGVAVPPHLRGNPGACLAVCTKALRFGFEPFALAEHSYPMRRSAKNELGGWETIETIAYDSFVIHAIIEAHAGLDGPLQCEYFGEGDSRVCRATGSIKGHMLEHTSPQIGQIKAARGRNDKGQIKGSPLWDTKPDQQLWYDTRRDWCRRYAPHVLMGIWDKDEFDENVPPEKPAESSPKLLDRLPGKIEGAGFQADVDVVDQALADEVAEEQEAKAEAKKAAAKTRKGTKEAILAEEGSQDQISPENPAIVRPTPSQPPASDEDEPPVDMQPTTAAQYDAFARIWIERTVDHKEIASRWMAEQPLRASLRVPIAIRKELESVVSHRIRTLRNEQRGV